MKPAKDSLVLYKQAPAVVSAAGEKLELSLPGGRSRLVREKDVVLLHPGPVRGFPDLETGAPGGQPEEAWELLQGESPTLAELADLVFGEYTPCTAWLAFKLLNRSPWFRGTPGAIEVVDAEVAAARIRADEEKAAAARRWEDFIGRFRERKIDPEADEFFLRDLEMYALGRGKGSRILKALGKTQSPENAHRVMLAYGVKEKTWNPHPLRLDVPLDVPDYSLADGENNPGGEPGETERLDLTHVEAFAVDDEDSKDPDDAVAWDGERFWVHVADAAAVIPPGSEADLAARERASSLYLPEKTVPMLPPEAVQRFGLGLASESPALSYAFGFDDDLRVTDFSIHLTRVRVTRLTYSEAEGRMAEGPLAVMKRITDAWARRREGGGAVSIRMPEVKVRVDDSGEVWIRPLPELDSRRLVAEAMLMAGAYAADFCRREGIPVPFAVQEGEGSVTAGVGLEGCGLGAGGVAGGAPEPPAPPSKGGPPPPQAVPGGTVAPPPPESSTPDYPAEFEKRRGMKRSRTTLECAPHFGLGLPAYTRVTSPLRRYPDLIASRQIRRHIRGEPLETPESVLAGLAAFESRGGSLTQAERRSNLFWKLQWLARRPGWSAPACLLDRRERAGLFLIPEIALEVRVPLKTPLSPGNRVILELREVDIPESSATFIIQETI